MDPSGTESPWKVRFSSPHVRLRKFANLGEVFLKPLGKPLGGFPNLSPPEMADDAPRVLIFAPHPDDECIIGGLALRLMRDRTFEKSEIPRSRRDGKTSRPGNGSRQPSGPLKER